MEFTNSLINRNTAPSGLGINISSLKGIKVLNSFTPTAKGAVSPDPAAPANVIKPVFGAQAAVTFGVGNSGQVLNDALSK